MHLQILSVNPEILLLPSSFVQRLMPGVEHGPRGLVAQLRLLLLIQNIEDGLPGHLHVHVS